MLSIVGLYIAIGTVVLFLSPVTSRTILNLFAYLKLVFSVSVRIYLFLYFSDELIKLNLMSPSCLRILSTPPPPQRTLQESNEFDPSSLNIITKPCRTIF